MLPPTLLFALCLVAGPASRVAAEVVTDGSLGGPATSIASGPLQLSNGAAANGYRIPDTLGSGAGANLFHSFARFGVEPGLAAVFTHDSGVAWQNVIARVTGGEASRILGLLRSEIPGADFYLLNPAGVLFGLGSSIDVPAGFHVSSADHLRLADGATFASTPVEGEVLSAAAPEAFGFLGPGAGPVHLAGGFVQSAADRFVVAAGSVGVGIGPDSGNPGDVPLRIPYGFLPAGMDIALVAVEGAGEVPLERPGDAATRADGFGPVHVSSGTPLQSTEVGGLEGPGGRIDILGAEVVIDAPGTRVTAGGGVPLEPGEPGGTPLERLRGADDGVHIVASELRISRATVGTGAEEGMEGAALPPVTIRADRVTIEDGGRVITHGSGAFAAGDVAIEASDSVRIVDDPPANPDELNETQPFGILAQAQGAGPGGDVWIRAGHLELLWKAHISVNSREFQSGDAGTVVLDVGTLRVAEGAAKIEASADGRGTGAAGSIHIIASESVELDDPPNPDIDGPPDPDVIEDDASPVDALSRPGLYVTAGRTGGGELVIEAPLLRLGGKARIDGGARDLDQGDGAHVEVTVDRLEMHDGRIDGSSSGSGRAGILEIRAREGVWMRSANLTSNTNYSGAPGRIYVEAPLVHLEGFAGIDTSANKPNQQLPPAPDGDGGAIELRVGRLEMDSGARIQTDTRHRGRGGSIDIRADESITLRSTAGFVGDPTRITALAEGDGRGGDVRIETPLLHLDGARISANTNGESGRGVPEQGIPNVLRSGRGGDVVIRGGDVLLENGARIQASSNASIPHAGDGGTVDIDVRSVVARSGGGVSARTNSMGDGGSVRVRASDRIELVSDRPRRSAIDTGTNQFGGNAGSVWVEAPRIVLRGSSIVARSEDAGEAGGVTVRGGTVELAEGAVIASDAGGTGSAGPVRVEASELLRVSGRFEEDVSSISSRTTGPAPGATVAVQAARLELADGGEISAESRGGGDAGSVSVAVGGELVARGGAVTTSAPAANGGDITVQAGERVDLVSSRIAADVGSGVGGNVTVAAPAVLLREASAITANAGDGQGGMVRIIADVVIQSVDSVVSASAGAQGVAGTVTIETPGYDFTSSLQALSSEFVDAVSLLAAHCAERRRARASFVVAGGRARPSPVAGPIPVAVAEPGAGPAPERIALVMEHEGHEGWRTRCDG